ncbi:MAG TPA: hypothetical protein VHP14_07835 [Anaerolineales bacterium]|nr:hypothetical protein [Anaerolineales bacterium]
MNAKQRTIALLALLLSLACAPSQIFVPTATPTPTITLTSTPVPPTPSPTLIPTITLTPEPTSTPTPVLSEIEKIVDGYLTAIEHDDWQIAYDYLCPEIQAQIRTPEEMYERILLEIGSIPDTHTILPPPDRPFRVLFILYRSDGDFGKWMSGTREARLEESSLKVCGVGNKHGDLRYLLQVNSPKVEPLDIDPFP